MKIEVLYFQGCPNHGPAVDRLRAALSAEGVAAEVVEIEVNDVATPESMEFLGSPTIRVNGIDVETSWGVARPIGISCRTYIDGATREGVPPMGLLRRAIRAAKIQEERR